MTTKSDSAGTQVDSGGGESPTQGALKSRRQTQSLSSDGKIYIDNIFTEYGSAIPPLGEVTNLSAEIPKSADLTVGEYTEKLSDLSDEEHWGRESRSSSSSHALTWIGRIAPLLRNPRVRCMAVLNAILAFVNLALIVVFIGILIRLLIVYALTQSQMLGQTTPCLYTYLPWGPCSATCWMGFGEKPKMERRVNLSSVIQARGGGKPECPSNFSKLVDYAPCNVLRCPQNLSAIGFRKECYYSDANEGASAGCYTIRNVPLQDGLIHIDSDLTKACRCPTDTF